MTERSEFTAGLRALADYLDATPGMPIPEFGTGIQISATALSNDATTRANVAAVAHMTGLPVIETDDEWRVSVKFPGGIEYYVLGIARERVNAWDALTSYSGSVSA